MLTQLLNAYQFEMNPPALESDLVAAERALGCALPPLVKDWYRAADRGRARLGGELELLPLASVQKYYEQTNLAAGPWGLFPFANNSDSNPICLCCKPPLAGYVVLVNHDDAPTLLYREADGFFRAAIEVAQRGEPLETHDLPSDFDGPQRTPEDLKVAAELVELARSGSNASGAAIDRQDRSLALRFACDLLPNADIAGISALLPLGDEYVREHVLRRLESIAAPEAGAAMLDERARYDAFVAHCVAVLKTAELQVSVHACNGQTTLRLDPDGIWLNTEMFFAARSRPDADAFLVERAQALLSQRRRPK